MSRSENGPAPEDVPSAADPHTPAAAQPEASPKSAAESLAAVPTTSGTIVLETPADVLETPADEPATGAEAPAEAEAAAPAPAPVRTGSRIDDLWLRIVRTPERARLLNWLIPALILLLAAGVRLWNLGFPHALVFDETFYVKDAYSLWGNGYESKWPDGVNERFNAGDVNIFLKDAAYIVHPPLGKWIIGVGMAIFGADNAFGWRITTALMGIIGVGLIMVVARTLTKSRTLAAIAGFLFAIDGHAIVMSRVAILDNSVMVFALLGFWFILKDRAWLERHLDAWIAQRGDAPLGSARGPVIWNRPWVFAAGLAFGATTSVKWSGLYFLAAFGIYLVAVDVLARRRRGLGQFPIGSALQALATFVLYVPIAAVVYLASWTGWLTTTGGYYRNWADDPANAWQGLFSWVPHSIQSLVFYHQQMYAFHVGLSTPHSYQANPLGWLAMIRPTSMWYVAPPPEDCGSNLCSQAITSIANPLIWWVAVLATLYLVYRLTRHQEWQVGLILMGMVAGYLPWLAYTERTVFQFYTIAFEPYLLLGLTFVIGLIIGKREDPRPRRTSGLATVGVFLGAATALSIFWYPLWTAITVPYWFWQMHAWFPSWI
ncbi:dolichyl-phosphate-mannose--protein mannosyltransferase [Mycetocola tolaasinivorans]|uniref:dolichyl-phosphate-mannose--protein mannosyltransferase n=1 Tax=Mycetocola tolaasinivorans TaxID=76635 RepID=UPI001FE7E4B7|nr:phospholipid carrier-dependent glycosyltransferase [Mycetocola tolaasinivorans]